MNIEWSIKRISVTNIMLDPSNIRMKIIRPTQSALIYDLFSNEDAFEIASSIAHNGFFPDEFPIVVKENGKYFVIEGNRRVAACKALINPDIIPSFSAKINSLPDIEIDKIRVVIAPNRTQAMKHIANKHTIISRRNWKPLRQAAFYKSQLENGTSIGELKEQYPEHDIVKFIKMLEMYALAESINYDFNVNSIVKDDRTFPITNLQRMYDDTKIRRFFDFDFDKNGKFVGLTNRETFLANYKKLVKDIALGKIDSRNSNTSEQRLEYINKFEKEKFENTDTKNEFNLGDIVGDKNLSSDKEPKKTEKKRSNRLPKGLIPSYIPYKLESSSLKYLYDELRSIDVEKYPNATHDLFRSFLECALLVCLKETKMFKLEWEKRPLPPKLSEMLTHVHSDGCDLVKDKNIRQIVEIIKSQFKEPSSLQRMNMINHNENYLSSSSDVRSLWAQVESLVKIIINPKDK